MSQLPHIDRQWSTPVKLPIPEDFRRHLPYPEIILQTLLRRGFSDINSAQQFLDHNLYSPASPYDLPDMEKGIKRVKSAISDDQMIGIWGDFDVDGQTSTAILVSALRAIKARHIFHIPVRGRESHGIGIEALKEFIDRGVKLILTCDTGISANDSIAYANSKGIDVIVTDHHLLPEVLPKAVAIINPRRLAQGHPLSTLPGAGTALKFSEALLASQKNDMDPASLHDLAALGIIADLADLNGDARYLTQSGLEVMRNSPRPALTALLEAAELNQTSITEEQVSFSLAPRLNAMGRLADANPIVNFLLSDDPAEIAITVNQVEGLNSRRKLLCDQVFAGAQSLIDRDRSLLDHAAIILHHPEWPAGVVGIVASRLMEIYHRPVLLLTGTPDQPLRGSARSVEGIDITAAIRKNGHLLLNYGGHPMAAGVSIQAENLTAFVHGMDRVLEEQFSQLTAGPQLLIDEVINPANVSLEVARALEVLAPYGPGNPPLVFSCDDLQIVETRSVGKLGEHLLVDVEDLAGNVNRLMRWNGTGLPLPEGRFTLAYTPRATNYRGESQVSFEWIDHRQSDVEIIAVAGKRKKIIENIDLRSSPSPVEDLERIITHGNVQVWKEGTDHFEVSGSSRDQLEPGHDLVLWSVPADYSILRQIIHIVRPEKIFWLLVSPTEHQLAVFLHHLALSVKNQLHLGKDVFSAGTLAASLGVNEDTIILGIEWLASKGALSIQNQSAEVFTLELGGRADPISQQKLERSLARVFQEIRAFTRHLRNSDLSGITEELR